MASSDVGRFLAGQLSAILLLAGSLGCQQSSQPAGTDRPEVLKAVVEAADKPPEVRSWAAAAAAQAPGQASEPETLEKVKAATVFIESRYRHIANETPREQELMVATGSGFVIGEEGLIVTNAHVVASVTGFDTLAEGLATSQTKPNERDVYILESVSVRTRSGMQHSRVYPAQVLCTKPMPFDLALLRIRAEKPLPALELATHANFKALQPGRSAVWALGFPLGHNLESSLVSFAKLPRNPHGPDISVRPGTVTALRHGNPDEIKVVEHSCNITSGSSGGPLVDENGRVIGVNYAGIDPKGGHNTNLAIPINVVWEKFRSTLAWLGKGPEGQMVQRRTLRVDPNDPAAFATPEAAIGDARFGDIIDIAAGRFEIARFNLADGIWVRGAGVGKTVLVGRSPAPVGIITGRLGLDVYCELSDLTLTTEVPVTDKKLRHFREGPDVIGLWVNDAAGAETYVHDVELGDRADLCWTPLVVGGSGSPNIVSCKINGHAAYTPSHAAVFIGESSGGRPRLERLQVSNGAVVITHGTTPALEACLVAPPSDFRSLCVFYDAKPLITGCRLTGVAVWGGGGEYRWNLLGPGRKDQPDHLRDFDVGTSGQVGGRVVINENLILVPIRISGSGTHAVVRGNLFMGRGAYGEFVDDVLQKADPVISLSDGATAEPSGNVALSPAVREVRAQAVQ